MIHLTCPQLNPAVDITMKTITVDSSQSALVSKYMRAVQAFVNTSGTVTRLEELLSSLGFSIL